MAILSWPEEDVPPALMRQVVALQDQAWPSDQPRPVHSSHDPKLEPISMMLVERGRVVAALTILSKSITHGGLPYSASGLSTVVTDASKRRRGYGSRLTEEARQTMRARGADIAIFTCEASLAPFYEASGFGILPGTVLVGGTLADPFPSDLLNLVTLASFFTTRAREHASDFVRSRIALYPGQIDKLW